MLISDATYRLLHLNSSYTHTYIYIYMYNNNVFVLTAPMRNESLQNQDEMQVVFRVTERQHGDSSHPRMHLVRRQDGAERFCQTNLL